MQSWTKFLLVLFFKCFQVDTEQERRMKLTRENPFEGVSEFPQLVKNDQEFIVENNQENCLEKHQNIKGK